MLIIMFTNKQRMLLLRLVFFLCKQFVYNLLGKHLLSLRSSVAWCVGVCCYLWLRASCTVTVPFHSILFCFVICNLCCVCVWNSLSSSRVCVCVWVWVQGEHIVCQRGMHYVNRYRKYTMLSIFFLPPSIPSSLLVMVTWPTFFFFLFFLVLSQGQGRGSTSQS